MTTLLALLAVLPLHAALTPAPKSAVPPRPAELRAWPSAGGALPPSARQVPYVHEAHGDARPDPYFWLRQRDTPEVLSYLKAENDYFEAYTAAWAPLREKLYRELRARIKEDDVTAPVKDGPYEYYKRTRQGEDYPSFCRRKAGVPGAPEEVLLDVNALARGHEYFSVPRVVPSPDHRLLAFPADTQGRRFYTWRFKDLSTGQLLPDRIESVTPNLVWGADSRTVLYTAQRPDTLRWEKVWRRSLGRPEAELVYFEEDETFSVELERSLSGRWIILDAHSTTTREARYLPADPTLRSLKTVLPRERGHEYSVVDGGDRFYILTNWKARNFRVMEASYENAGDKALWKEVVPHRPDVLVEDVEALAGHLVLTERSAGLTHLRLIDRARPGLRASTLLSFRDPAYVAALGDVREYDAAAVRYEYESMTTPPSSYDYELATGKHVLRKRQEILGGFDPARYESKRLMLPARDGVRVPVSLVYRKDLFRKGAAPGLVYGYGSYGASTDAEFDEDTLSLLDRGFVYAIAHVRGGSELGRAWYLDGRQDKKLNTFRDFIDVTEGLVRAGWIAKGRVYAMGGSAGGLLMGAVANMRPELYRGILAYVPFVDAVTTMLDASIPLTTSEYDEWGDPNEPRFYRYIKSYSPYDNVRATAYPAMYVETGYHDSQVQYWEPAKWVARLRALNTGSAPILMRTEMSAGHSGRTGRFVRLEETARSYAFMLGLEGLD